MVWTPRDSDRVRRAHSCGPAFGLPPCIPHSCDLPPVRSAQRHRYSTPRSSAPRCVERTYRPSFFSVPEIDSPFIWSRQVSTSAGGAASLRRTPVEVVGGEALAANAIGVILAFIEASSLQPSRLARGAAPREIGNDAVVRTARWEGEGATRRSRSISTISAVHPKPRPRRELALVGSPQSVPAVRLRNHRLGRPGPHRT